MNEEEDATQLHLGADFKDAQCLLNSEVAVLLQHRMATSGGANDHTASPAFQQTLSYVQRFSRFKNKEALKTVRVLLKKKNLAEFEIASLSNLLPETPEEAKALLPTLRKFDDDELQSILNELANLRTTSLVELPVIQRPFTDKLYSASVRAWKEAFEECNALLSVNGLPPCAVTCDYEARLLFYLRYPRFR